MKKQREVSISMRIESTIIHNKCLIITGTNIRGHLPCESTGKLWKQLVH
jgi:hypothetical protein